MRKKKCHASSAFQALMGMKRKAAIFLIFAALFCVSKDGMGLVFQNARWYNITIYTVSKDIYFQRAAGGGKAFIWSKYKF